MLSNDTKVERTSLPYITGLKSSLFTAQNFWNNTNITSEQLRQIEDKLLEKQTEVFDVDLNNLIYDATNFFTYIDTMNPSELAKRGHCIIIYLLQCADERLEVFSVVRLMGAEHTVKGILAVIGNPGELSTVVISDDISLCWIERKSAGVPPPTIRLMLMPENYI